MAERDYLDEIAQYFVDEKEGPVFPDKKDFANTALRFAALTARELDQIETAFSQYGRESWLDGMREFCAEIRQDYQNYVGNGANVHNRHGAALAGWQGARTRGGKEMRLNVKKSGQKGGGLRVLSDKAEVVEEGLNNEVLRLHADAVDLLRREISQDLRRVLGALVGHFEGAQMDAGTEVLERANRELYDLSPHLHVVMRNSVAALVKAASVTTVGDAFPLLADYGNVQRLNYKMGTLKASKKHKVVAESSENFPQKLDALRTLDAGMLENLRAGLSEGGIKGDMIDLFDGDALNLSEDFDKSQWTKLFRALGAMHLGLLLEADGLRVVDNSFKVVKYLPSDLMDVLGNGSPGMIRVRNFVLAKLGPGLSKKCFVPAERQMIEEVFGRREFNILERNGHCFLQYRGDTYLFNSDGRDVQGVLDYQGFLGVLREHGIIDRVDEVQVRTRTGRNTGKSAIVKAAAVRDRVLTAPEDFTFNEWVLLKEHLLRIGRENETMFESAEAFEATFAGITVGNDTVLKRLTSLKGQFLRGIKVKRTSSELRTMWSSAVMRA